MTAVPFFIIAILLVVCCRNWRAAERRCKLLEIQRDEALKAVDTYRSACEVYEQAIAKYRGLMERCEAIMRGTR